MLSYTLSEPSTITLTDARAIIHADQRTGVEPLTNNKFTISQRLNYIYMPKVQAHCADCTQFHGGLEDDELPEQTLITTIQVNRNFNRELIAIRLCSCKHINVGNWQSCDRKRNKAKFSMEKWVRTEIWNPLRLFSGLIKQ